MSAEIKQQVEACEIGRTYLPIVHNVAHWCKQDQFLPMSLCRVIVELCSHLSLFSCYVVMSCQVKFNHTQMLNVHRFSCTRYLKSIRLIEK